MSIGMNDVWAPALLARDALNCTFPETRRVLGDFLFQCVGRKRGKRGATARQNTKHGPESGASQHGRECLLELRPFDPKATDAFGQQIVVLPLLQVDGDLSEREQAHGDRDEADAVDQLRYVEREAGDA